MTSQQITVPVPLQSMAELIATDPQPRPAPVERYPVRFMFVGTILAWLRRLNRRRP